MTLIKAIFAFLAVIREIFALKRSADDRQAGRDEVMADQARQKDARLDDAMRAEVEADKAHKTIMPGDEAFDTSFRRD